MMKIDKIKISVEACAYDNSSNIQHFCRELTFENGLNLVVGDNTSGKTTIVECMFYALGMEELIEGKNGNKTLDKAVKRQFEYKGKDGIPHEWYVKKSSVFLQLTNSKGKVITVKRLIIDSDNDKRTNVIFVWEASMDKAKNYQDSREYYVHGWEDHNEDNNTGFYAYIAGFASLPIIQVAARNTDRTLLYMQTVFAVSYIEQKRGWSDFFANIRSFNISNPKQRLIEYVMNYETNEDLLTSIRLKEDKKTYENEWEQKVYTIKNYLSYNNLFVEKLEYNIRKQSVSLNDLRLSSRYNKLELSANIENLKKRVKELEVKQQEAQEREKNPNYQAALEKYECHKDEYDKFCIDLVGEEDKLGNIDRQIEYITDEIKRYDGLLKVNNIVTAIDVRICPTCHQPMPINANKDADITSDQIQDSKDILNQQRKFLQPMKKRLSLSIENRKLNKLYLEKQLSIEEEEAKTLAAENNINLYPLTIEEQFELVKNKTDITNLIKIREYVQNELEHLRKIYDQYQETCKKLEQLKDGKNEEQPIFAQLNLFKDLLNLFNYESNNVNTEVFFKEEETSYKYFPVVRHGDYEEEIRSDSSASDFIRSIWAYYLTLLRKGKRHPGFLVMDEPCQHSMKEQSLQNLFEYCARQTDKQIILFCSSQPQTEEEKENNKDIEDSQNVIQRLADNIESNGLKVNYQVIDPKAIVPIPDNT